MPNADTEACGRRSACTVARVASGVASIVFVLAAVWLGRSTLASPAIAVWIAAMLAAAFATIGCWRATRPGSPSSPIPPPVRAALACVALLALGLRVVDLDERPLFGGDEANWGVVARTFLRHGGDPFAAGYLGFPALGEFVTAAAIALGGETIAALRWPAALAGAFTALIVGVYAARTWGGAAGIAAAFVAASTLVHVHLSRQGLPNVIDALVAAIGLFALEAAWRTRRRSLFVAAGLALGVAQYFYATARAAPLVAIGFVVLRFITERREAMKLRVDLAAMAFAFAVAALPEALRALDHPVDWLAPMTRRSEIAMLVDGIRTNPAAGLAVVLQRLGVAAAALVAVPLRGLMVPAVPLLDVAYAVAFVAGLAELAYRWRDSRSQMLLMWIAAVIAIATVSESTPAGQRYAMALPAAAVVVGVGAAGIVRLVSRATRYKTPAIAACTALIGIAFASQAILTLRAYFADRDRWISTFREPTTELAADLVAHIRAAPPGTRIVMLGAPVAWYHGLGQFAYLVPATLAHDVEASDDVGSAVAKACPATGSNASASVDCLVVVLPHRQTSVATLRERYRVLHVTAAQARDGLHLYTLLGLCARCPDQNAADGGSPGVGTR